MTKQHKSFISLYHNSTSRKKTPAPINAIQINRLTLSLYIDNLKSALQITFWFVPVGISIAAQVQLLLTSLQH